MVRSSASRPASRIDPAVAADPSSNTDVRRVDLMLDGGTIITMDEERTVYTSAAVAIAGDRIAAVGPRTAIRNDFTADRVIDAADALVLPGLVCTHSHGFQVVYRGLGDDLELFAWLRRMIYPLSALLGPTETYEATLLCCMDLMKTGTTTFADSLELSLEATAVFRSDHIEQVPDEEGRLNDCITYGHATHVAVVEVDTESGSVTVIDYVVVHDSGTIVNPSIVEGQIVGGVAQGVGAALLEEVAYNEDGQILTLGLMDYALPSAIEMPRGRVAHFESPASQVPGGFRGVGESGIIGAPAAIAGAVEDALVSDGARVHRLPLTPERVHSLARSALRGDETTSGSDQLRTTSEGSPG